MRRRATSTRDCPSRPHQTMPSSSSLLGSLFGSKRGKPPPQAHPPPALPQPPPHPPGLPHPQHLVAGHHQGPAEGPPHGHHTQYCHVQQNPPPYHHHHHYHPPQHVQHSHQYHHVPHGGHLPYGAHSHSHPSLPSAHASHTGHTAHHHGQPLAPPPPLPPHPPPAARPSPAASAQLCRQLGRGSRTPGNKCTPHRGTPGVASLRPDPGHFCFHLFPCSPRPRWNPLSPWACV